MGKSGLACFEGCAGAIINYLPVSQLTHVAFEHSTGRLRTTLHKKVSTILRSPGASQVDRLPFHWSIAKQAITTIT
jgi:hypothetical protein